MFAKIYSILNIISNITAPIAMKTILTKCYDKYTPWVSFTIFFFAKMFTISLLIKIFIVNILGLNFLPTFVSLVIFTLNSFSIKIFLSLIIISIVFELFSNKELFSNLPNTETILTILVNRVSINFKNKSIFYKNMDILLSSINLKKKADAETFFNFFGFVFLFLHTLIYKNLSKISFTKQKGYIFNLRQRILFLEYLLLIAILVPNFFNHVVSSTLNKRFNSLFIEFNIINYVAFIAIIIISVYFIVSLIKPHYNIKTLNNNITEQLGMDISTTKGPLTGRNFVYFILPVVQTMLILYKCFKELNDPISNYLLDTSYLVENALITIDWLSWPFILLTVIIIYATLFLFYHKPQNIQSESKWSNSLNIINLNILLLFLFLAFTTNDLLVFYFMFESTLIPMFFLLGFFGSRTRKIRAAYSFFLYTMLGSVALLIGIFSLVITYKTTQINLLTNYNDLANVPNYVWWCLFWGFGVKVPIMPMHNWLAEAHVEAPTIGSVILAALLLKLGGYGIIRILFLVLPNLSILNAPYAIAINTLSFFYASFMALRQFDFKRIIAYSSIAHMNFALIGIFSFNIEAVQGAIFLMVAHGIVSAGLFIGVGLLYELIATRLIITFGGLKRVWPTTAFLFLIFILANFGFPLTPNFVGELLIIIGGVHQILTVMTLVTVGTILTLVYSLVLYSKIFLGILRPEVNNWSVYLLNINTDKNIFSARNISVLNYNIVLRFLLILCIITGLYPTVILQLTNDYVAWFLIQKYYFI